MTSQEEDLPRLLFKRERQLMDGEFRRDRMQVSALLHDDFLEFGSSGRVWSRDEILELLAMEPFHVAPTVEDFALRLTASNTALVTYRAVRNAGATLRSSLWVRDGEEWKVLFHQGTEVPHL